MREVRALFTNLRSDFTDTDRIVSRVPRNPFGTHRNTYVNLHSCVSRIIGEREEEGEGHALVFSISCISGATTMMTSNRCSDTSRSSTCGYVTKMTISPRKFCYVSQKAENLPAADKRLSGNSRASDRATFSGRDVSLRCKIEYVTLLKSLSFISPSETPTSWLPASFPPPTTAATTTMTTTFSRRLVPIKVASLTRKFNKKIWSE